MVESFLGKKDVKIAIVNWKKSVHSGRTTNNFETFPVQFDYNSFSVFAKKKTTQHSKK